MGRPVLALGDVGCQVVVAQQALGITDDGYFGPATNEAVIAFQVAERLEADGIIGEQTWSALAEASEEPLPPYPPPLPSPFDPSAIEEITAMAAGSPIASYSWRDRGRAPAGYTEGMAIAYAYAYDRLLLDSPIAWDMARADTGDDDVDALAWYRAQFQSLGMSNTKAGADTLRHLFVLLMGLGMRESSGKHCCGRDQSATNTTSDTAEAGMFQTSWNASNCSTDFVVLLDQYSPKPLQCALDVFKQGVSCSSSNWDCYGSGTGLRYQELAKSCPLFAVDTTAIGLRRLRQHWGPINRREAELRREADEMFLAVQDIVDQIEPPEPEPPPADIPTVRIETIGAIQITVNGRVIRSP